MSEKEDLDQEIQNLQELWDFNTSDTDGEEYIRLPFVSVNPSRMWPEKQWFEETAQGAHEWTRTLREFREMLLNVDQHPILRAIVQDSIKKLSASQRKLWGLYKITNSGLIKKAIPKTVTTLKYFQKKFWKLDRKLRQSD